MLSREFPSTHPRHGEKTGFATLLQNTLCFVSNDERRNCEDCCSCPDWLKYHTIRANAALWKKRAVEINAGRAKLSVRQWSGKPYEKGTFQIEIARLPKLHVQDITLGIRDEKPFASVEGQEVDVDTLAKHDGLSTADFVDWFKLDHRKDDYHGGVLHFTDLRY